MYMGGQVSILATLHLGNDSALRVDWETVGLRIGLEIAHTIKLCLNFKPC